MQIAQNFADQTDEELVNESLRDPQAFGLLIDRYQPKLIRYIRQISDVSYEEAEDILQESFIKAYYNLRGFDTSLKFSSWMYRIVHNQVINQYRKSSVRPQGHSVSLDKKHLSLFASELDTAREVDLAYLQNNIQRVFAGMDVKYREVLVLRYFEEKEYSEISDILKKPIGTISTLLNRAKKQFKKKAEELGLALN